MNYLVQIGALGDVGRFRSADAQPYVRGQRVIVRSVRGMEVGEVLASAEQRGQSDGLLLRPMTPQDEMLAERLRRNRDEAFQACTELLTSRGSTAALIDVEHLFDGRGLYFYFLGTPDAIADQITAELASAYDAQARIGQFAETLSEGCGPGCGTEEAENGCGTSGACATCAVASACSTGSRLQDSEDSGRLPTSRT